MHARAGGSRGGVRAVGGVHEGSVEGNHHLLGGVVHQRSFVIASEAFGRYGLGGEFANSSNCAFFRPSTLPIVVSKSFSSLAISWGRMKGASSSHRQQGN